MCPKLVIDPNPYELNTKDFEIHRHELKRLRKTATEGCLFLDEFTCASGQRFAPLSELNRCADVAFDLLLEGKNPDSFTVQKLLRCRRGLLEYFSQHPQWLKAYRFVYRNQGARLTPNQTNLNDAAYLVGLLFVQAIYLTSAALRVASMHYYRLGLPQAVRLLLLHYETQDHLSGENRGVSEKLSSLEDLAFTPTERQFKLRCDNGYKPLRRECEHDPLLAFHDSGALFVGLPARSYDIDMTVFTSLRGSYPHRCLPMTVIQHNRTSLTLQYFDREEVQRKLHLPYLYRSGRRLSPTDSELNREPRTREWV